MMVPSTPELVAEVAANMRPMDRAEIFATRHTDNLDSIIEQVTSYSAAAAIALHNDKPAAACGIMELWPGVWSPWMFATDSWSFVSAAVSKYAKGYLTTFAENKGMHRAQVYSLATHSDAHTWLEWLGFEREALLKKFGRNKEDFYLYAKVSPCV